MTIKKYVLITIILALVLVLSGCAYRYKPNENNPIHGLCYFIELGDLPDFAGYAHTLWCDTTTGVIYMQSYGTYVNSFTPLLNSDGTPKIWKDERRDNYVYQGS